MQNKPRQFNIVLELLTHDSIPLRGCVYVAARDMPILFFATFNNEKKKNACSSTQAHFPFVNAPFLKGKYKKFLSPIVEVYL